jgi:thiol-disulfide isomerase/thioredoxin
MEYFDESSIEQAFEKAKKTGKPLLIDFWATGCKGCKKMEIHTYAAEDIQKYLNSNYVLVKVNSRKISKAFKNAYTTSAFLWTPTFFIFSSDQQELKRSTGFMPPNQFRAELDLGLAFNHMRRWENQAALFILESLYNYAEQSTLKEEALYWAGVAAFYAHQKSQEHLSTYWNRLLEKYPGSLWSERADCLEVVL